MMAASGSGAYQSKVSNSPRLALTRTPGKTSAINSLEGRFMTMTLDPGKKNAAAVQQRAREARQAETAAAE